ncbi:hypothetical protein PO909_006702 [Leuciscus waleckii]
MVQTWPRLRLYAFPPVALLPGVLERVRRDRVCLLLIAPRCRAEYGFPILCPSSTGILWSFLSGGAFCPKQGAHPPARTVEPVGLASEGAQLIESGLSTEVAETILQSRAPSTRKLYALKWRVFTSLCSDRRLDPVNCPIGTVLEFLQDRFTAADPVHFKASIRRNASSLERERLGYDCNLGSLKKRALRHLAISPSCLQHDFRLYEAFVFCFGPAFIASWYVTHPPLTFRHTIGLILHVLQDVITQSVPHSVNSTQRSFPLQGTEVTVVTEAFSLCIVTDTLWYEFTACENLTTPFNVMSSSAKVFEGLHIHEMITPLRI